MSGSVHKNDPASGKKTDQVKTELIALIRSGEFPEGSFLPGCNSLANRFSISPMTMREVLSNLNELGIISVQNGRAAQITTRPVLHKITIMCGVRGVDVSEFWGDFVDGIQSEIARHEKYSAEFIVFDKPPEQIRMRDFDLPHTSGVIFFGLHLNRAVRAMRKYHMPYMQIYEHADPLEDNCITTDFTLAMAQIAQAFAAAQRKRIVIFSNAKEPGINREKENLLLEALMHYDLLPSRGKYLFHVPTEPRGEAQSMDFVYHTALRLFSAKRSCPDAIMLMSDMMALPLYRAAAECALPIPEACSVASCDNLLSGKYLTPSLTTLELSRFTQGTMAAAELIRKMEHPNLFLPPRRIPAQVIWRESCTMTPQL